MASLAPCPRLSALPSLLRVASDTPLAESADQTVPRARVPALADRLGPVAAVFGLFTPHDHRFTIDFIRGPAFFGFLCSSRINARWLFFCSARHSARASPAFRLHESISDVSSRTSSPRRTMTDGRRPRASSNGFNPSVPNPNATSVFMLYRCDFFNYAGTGAGEQELSPALPSIGVIFKSSPRILMRRCKSSASSISGSLPDLMSA